VLLLGQCTVPRVLDAVLVGGNRPRLVASGWSSSYSGVRSVRRSQERAKRVRESQTRSDLANAFLSWKTSDESE
jgi:hypothetical protein